MTERHCDKCGKPTKDENQIGYRIEGVLLCWSCASNELRMTKAEEK